MRQAHDGGERRAPRQAEWIARRVASDPAVTDHDLWRARKTLSNELYRLERTRSPVPIRILYARRIIESAQRYRGLAGTETI